MKVLDVKYKINCLNKPNDYMKQNDCVGYCDFDNKEIYYLKGSDCLIHELIHAYLDRYKRYDLSRDEEVVETIEAIFKDLIKKLGYRK